jgi:folylpolyglutamate synthase
VPLNTAISHVQLGKVSSCVSLLLYRPFVGLSGAHQYQNASLAIALARAFLRDANLKDTIPESYMSGLKEVRWPGRCQTVLDSRLPGITWYLDGAHTSESIECCLQWFVTPNVGLFDRSEKLVRSIWMPCLC